MLKVSRKGKSSFPRTYAAAEKFQGHAASLTRLNAIEWKPLLGLVVHANFWKEAALLETTCISRENQYRGTDYFQRLKEVTRYVWRLDSLGLRAMLDDLHDIWKIGQLRHDALFPCRECVAIAMKRIHAGCKILTVMMDSCVKSGEALLRILAIQHNTANAVLWLALAARLRVLAGCMLTKLVELYNKLANILPLLTPHPDKPNNQLLECLPYNLNHEFKVDSVRLWPTPFSPPCKSWVDHIEALAKETAHDVPRALAPGQTVTGEGAGISLTKSLQDSVGTQAQGGGKLHPAFGMGLLAAQQHTPGVNQGLGARQANGALSLTRMMRGNGSGFTMNLSNPRFLDEKNGADMRFGGRHGGSTKRKASSGGSRGSTPNFDAGGRCSKAMKMDKAWGSGGAPLKEQPKPNSSSEYAGRIQQRYSAGDATSGTKDFQHPGNQSPHQAQKCRLADRNDAPNTRKLLPPSKSGEPVDGGQGGNGFKGRTLAKRKKGRSSLPGWGKRGCGATGQLKNWDEWFDL